MPGSAAESWSGALQGRRTERSDPDIHSLLKSEPASSPEAQRLTTLLGIAHYGLGEYAAAVPYLKTAAADDPQNLPFRLLLAHSCLSSQQFQCVLDVYHEILTLNAESAEADMLAGEALDEMKDNAGAIGAVSRRSESRSQRAECALRPGLSAVDPDAI